MKCDDCGIPMQIGDWPFCPHGPARNYTIVPDSIPGGVVIENLSSTPKRYYSRSEIKLACEVAGVKPMVRHVGAPGSDKSPYTTRWV